MSIHQLKQFPSRPIIRNRILRRSQTIKVVLALLICLEFPTQIELLLLGILLLIQPIGRRLPDLNGGSNKRLLRLEIHHLAVHKHHLSIRGLVGNNAITVLAVRRIGAEERAQNSGSGGSVFCLLGEFEGYFVDETVFLLA